MRRGESIWIYDEDIDDFKCIRWEDAVWNSHFITSSDDPNAGRALKSMWAKKYLRAGNGTSLPGGGVVADASAEFRAAFIEGEAGVGAAAAAAPEAVSQRPDFPALVLANRRLARAMLGAEDAAKSADDLAALAVSTPDWNSTGVDLHTAFAIAHESFPPAHSAPLNKPDIAAEIRKNARQSGKKRASDVGAAAPNVTRNINSGERATRDQPEFVILIRPAIQHKMLGAIVMCPPPAPPMPICSHAHTHTGAAA